MRRCVVLRTLLLVPEPALALDLYRSAQFVTLADYPCPVWLSPLQPLAEVFLRLRLGGRLGGIVPKARDAHSG